MGYSAKTDAAFEMLHRDILNGSHAPGQPLRIAALSGLYGVSATPLREALSRLEEKQLVVGSANRGWRVAPVSLPELEDLEIARLTVETSLLEDAIAHGDLDWESGIVAAHHRMTQVAPPAGNVDVAARQLWDETHDAFHIALHAAGRSSWLKRFFVRTAEQLRLHHQALLFHPRAINPNGPEKHTPETEALLSRAHSVTAHTELMQVVLDRDAVVAREKLRLHVEITLEVFRSIAGASVKEKKAKREEQVT